MAEKLLSGIVNGEIDHTLAVSAIENNRNLQVKDLNVSLTKFVSHFMQHLHEKLTPSLDARNIYYSPRQVAEKKKTQIKKDIVAPDGKKTARISLQYASSSPARNVSKSSANDFGLDGISPIKTTRKASNHRKNKKRITTLPATNQTTCKSFELNADDFPAISSTVSSKNPRRITTTPVDRTSFHVFKVDNSTNSAFLEESSFEASNADSTFNGLFTDDKRFSRISSKASSGHGDSVFFPEQSANGFDSSFGGSSFSTNNIAQTPTKKLEIFSMNDVSNQAVLKVYVDIYASICQNNLIPNFTLEIYFLFVTLTYSTKSNEYNESTFPFTSVQNCVYFAAKSIAKLQKLVAYLDTKSLQLLIDNVRLKNFLDDEEVLKHLQDVIVSDTAERFTDSLYVKSPMTGIPFQVESDNRKRFLTDKHFYAFSKKRDAFYALIRGWQEHHLDVDWNMKTFMVVKVSELMKSNENESTHYQFAKLFVAQLLEMCRNSVGSKRDEPNTSDSLLLEFKKSNPAKFRNLQDRLTQPSVSHDLCPEPSFSMVEEFFRMFIAIADSYCFNKFLIHVLLSHILEINSHSFGLDADVNNQLNKSDFAASLWKDIKIAVTELRLLAKFLGYVTFLPYSSTTCNESSFHDSRHLVSESLNLIDYLETSYRKRRLLITVPWTVEFLSMADKNAFKLRMYSKPLRFLTALLSSDSMKIIHKNFSLLHFALLLHIGWLLEQPSVQAGQIERESINLNELDCNEIRTGIDDIVSMDKCFLYDLCPYLNDVKKPLTDFMKASGVQSANGSFRKITAIKTSDSFSIDMKSTLKMQLLENFMKYLPSHVKDCIKFITERHTMNVKQHITSSIMTLCSQHVVNLIKVKLDCDVEDLTMDNLKIKNRSLYAVCLEEGRQKMEVESDSYLKLYLEERVPASTRNLLPDSVHEKILDVSTKVVKHNVRLKIQEWFNTNRELYLNAVESLYHRFLKSIIKDAKQESSINKSSKWENIPME